MVAPPTQSGNEEEVLDAVTHRIRQSQVDESFDVQMIHQGQPGVILGLQGVRGQRVCGGVKKQDGVMRKTA